MRSSPCRPDYRWPAGSNGSDHPKENSHFQSIKITDTHRPKLAVVYVRQSSPQQVVENRESLARQYSLADYARALGWPAVSLAVDEWWIRDLADEMGVGLQPIQGMGHEGLCPCPTSRQPRRHLVIWADAEERDRLRRLRDGFRSPAGRSAIRPS